MRVSMICSQFLSSFPDNQKYYHTDKANPLWDLFQ